MSTTHTEQEPSTEIALDQWAWWCRDNQALQERSLGNANCLVCAQEPTKVLAWGCGPGECSCSSAGRVARDISHHVLFKGCEHRIDVIFSWAALDRMYP